MPQVNSYKEYYTAKEVKEKLGITDGQLYNYVRYGHLERVMPPGRKQGVYKRAEVDKFALEMRAFLSGREEAKRTTFTKVTKNDVRDFVKLTDEIFKVHLNVGQRIDWVKKNPDVLYQLCLDSQVIGAAVILPLKPEKIEQILRDEASADEIQADEIEEYEAGKSYHLYVTGVGVSPAFNKTDRRIYGAKLARGIGDAIIELGKRGIEIEAITGRSETVDGIRLARHAGFKQIPSITYKKNFRIRSDEVESGGTILEDILLQHRKELLEVKRLTGSKTNKPKQSTRR